MRSNKLRGTLLATGFLVAFAAACSPTVQVHGYVPSDADVANVRPGADNFESVSQKLGQPSSSALLGDRAWYYVQSTVESFTYNAPEVIDRKVLAVKFSQNGVVTGVTKYGLEDGRIVNLTARTTETGGRELGVLEQIFGNLMNMDAQQLAQP